MLSVAQADPLARSRAIITIVIFFIANCSFPCAGRKLALRRANCSPPVLLLLVVLLLACSATCQYWDAIPTPHEGPKINPAMRMPEDRTSADLRDRLLSQSQPREAGPHQSGSIQRLVIRTDIDPHAVSNQRACGLPRTEQQ